MAGAVKSLRQISVRCIGGKKPLIESLCGRVRRPTRYRSLEGCRLQAETENRGTFKDDLNEATQEMCCREPFHDIYACGDNVMSLEDGHRRQLCEQYLKQLICFGSELPGLLKICQNHLQEPRVIDCVLGEDHSSMPQNVPRA